MLNSEIRTFASRYRKTKQLKKISDAIIAGTARHYRLNLYTFDMDFKTVKDFSVIILEK